MNDDDEFFAELADAVSSPLRKAMGAEGPAGPGMVGWAGTPSYAVPMTLTASSKGKSYNAGDILTSR